MRMILMKYPPIEKYLRREKNERSHISKSFSNIIRRILYHPSLTPPHESDQRRGVSPRISCHDGSVSTYSALFHRSRGSDWKAFRTGVDAFTKAGRSVVDPSSVRFAAFSACGPSLSASRLHHAWLRVTVLHYSR